jgi:hypothetical protein
MFRASAQISQRLRSPLRFPTPRVYTMERTGNEHRRRKEQELEKLIPENPAFAPGRAVADWLYWMLVHPIKIWCIETTAGRPAF